MSADSRPHRLARRERRRRLAVDLVGIMAMTALVRAVYGAGYLAADAAQALTRGSQLIHGRLPDYASAFSSVPEQAAATAPTPHPLSYVVSGVATLPGRDFGYSAMIALSFLAFGALLWGLFRLGESISSWPTGVFAAVVIGDSIVFADRGVTGGVDVWFASVLVWALVAEVRQPRRGRVVLVLLGVAGVLRPDAWVFAAVYAAYVMPVVSPRRKAETVVLVIVPPLLWLAFDGIITGDPLYSLTHTQSAAETLQRPTGVKEVPHAFVDNVRDMLRLPVVAGGLAGTVLAIAVLRSVVTPLVAVMVLGTAMFAALGVLGLPLNNRYLFDVAMVLATFAGYLAFGWTEATRIRLRPLWAAAGVLLVLAVVVKAPTRVSEIRNERAAIATRVRVVDAIQSLMRQPSARAAVARCGGVQVFDVRAVPYLAYFLHRRVRDLSFFSRSAPPRKAVVIAPEPFVTTALPTDPYVMSHGGYEVPAGYRKVSGNNTWTMYESPACA